MRKIFFAILYLSILMACNDNSTNGVMKVQEAPVNNSTIEEKINDLLHESDYDFAEVFDAIEDGNYDEAIDYLDAEIKDLEEEAEDITIADLEAVGQSRFNVSIQSLQKLLVALKKAEVSEVENSTDLSEKLAEAFANAEMTVAHNYLILTNTFLLDEPEMAESYFYTVISKIESATSRLKGSAKKEATIILIETKSLIDKEGTFIEKEDAQVAKSIQKQLDNIATWLQKYTK